MARMEPSTAWGLLGRRHLEMVLLSFDNEKTATVFFSLKYVPSPNGHVLAEALLW